MSKRSEDVFDELRRRAEEVVAAQGEPELPSEDSPRRVILELVHELRMHQAELEIQNEELRDAQNELSALHREYERLYEFAPCAYLTLDPRGFVRRANLTATRMLGRERLRIVRSYFSSYFTPESAMDYLAARESAERSGKEESFEVELQAAGEATTWLRGVIRAERDASERLAGWWLALIDASEMKRAQAERERLESQLHEAQRLEALAQLGAGIAHHFNNLLLVIGANAELVDEELALDSPLKEPTSEVRRAAKRASHLVEHLSAFSRRQTFSLEELELNEAVSEATRAILSLLPRQVRLVYEPGPDAGRVLANAAGLERVLVELCRNARDAMARRGGTITLRTGCVHFDEDLVRRHEGAEPGDHAFVSVADTGPGMDPGTRQRAFEPFFTTKRVGEGEGLGLSAVYGLVKQLEGLVVMESEPGAGTSVTVYLPSLGEVPGRCEPPPDLREM